jgi:hypothetical protein
VAWARLAASCSLLQSTAAGLATRAMASTLDAARRATRDLVMILPPKLLGSSP